MSTLELLSLDCIPFAVMKVTEKGTIHNINRLAEHLIGYNQAELVGQHLTIIVKGCDIIDKLGQNEQNKQDTARLASGSIVKLLDKSNDLSSCGLRVSDVEGGYIVCFTDIRSGSSVAASDVSADAEQILNGMEEAFWQWDVNADTLFFSAQAMALLGYDKESSCCDMSFWQKHIAKNDLKDIYQQVEQHIAGNLPCISLTFPVSQLGGTKKWVSCIGKVLEYKYGKAHKLFASLKDVTESHTLIASLKESNDYLSLAEQLNNSGHWRIDLRTNALFWSRGMYLIHQVDYATYQPRIGRSLAFYGQQEGKRIQQQIQKAIIQKKGFHCQSTITTATGNKTKVESLGEVELDEAGQVISVFGIFRDITRTEDVFEKLKLLAMVNHTIKVPIFFIDELDNIVYQDLSPQVNNQSSLLFNYINFSLNDYLAFKEEAKTQGQLKKISISFDNYHSVYDFSITYESDEGIYIWIVENVTDKFRKEQQHIITDRLTLLGNTFGNVSHDINNVLGVALGAIEMLEIKFSQGNQDISAYISRVKNAIDKGKDVTERLLAFTRRPTIKVVQFDPIKDINDNIYLFKQMLLSTIDFSFHANGVNCLINFPQGEFINILLNLVLNAQDAIREHALIGNIKMTANINPDGQLEIHVKDSGIGIKQENLSRIFDPFYSSKSVNKGNGIGLANVYSTVYKHDGQIQVAGKSDLGGALFTLVFNCSQHIQTILGDVTVTNELGVFNKSILILDDELSIAEFVALYLESEGANTQHVTTRKGLLEQLASNQHFDIFITDMILPDISGRDALNFVLAKFPDIKVYSISGYIAEQDQEWQYPVLRKPFNSSDLAKFLSV